MSDTATRKDIEEVLNVIQVFTKQVDDRFNRVEAELKELNDKYSHLVSTIDGFVSRIDRYETELAARDNQFNKLLEWAHKVSKKTGIPLENL